MCLALAFEGCRLELVRGSQLEESLRKLLHGLVAFRATYHLELFTAQPNVLDNGVPKPLDPHWALPRGSYPCMVCSDYPDNIEFDIYYEATDEHIQILLPFGHI